MRKLSTLFAIFFLFTGTLMAQFAIIGTATTTTGGTTIDPVDRYYNYTHVQIIYTAAELSAAGMQAGSTITAIGFNISESAVSLANFTIKMGLTSQSLAQPYISTLTTVKPAFTYTPVVQPAGTFDMIPLTTTLLWDGASNIVVNTCTGSNPYTSPYGGLYYTSATSGLMTYVRTDGTDNCANTALTSTTYRPNIRFNYTPPPPCAGTPTPGNTLSSANPVCSGVNFTLSLQNVTPGTGVIYQWQSSPDGSTWSNTGTSVSSLTTTQTAATYYRCQVTCSGNTGISVPVQVLLNPFYNCYCISGATYTGDEDILNVTVGTLNNTSTCATVGPGPGSLNQIYSNYMGFVTPPVFNAGQVQNLSIQIGTCGGNYSNCATIYIDYNHNGSFADAGEQVYLSASSISGPHTETGTFTVPAGAMTGITGMRVISVETTTPSAIGPCVTYGWGETEDYFVNIMAQPGVTTTAATAVTGTTATLNATISANGATTTSLFEYGTSATPPFSNTINVAGNVTTQNAPISQGITGLQPNTTYYFRAVSNNSVGTVNGTILSFTTAMVAPAAVSQNPSVIGSTFATMNGSATAYNATTTVSFEWGTTLGGPYPNSAPGIPSTVTGSLSTNFYANLTALVINTNYYYRAKAVNGAGTTYGAEKTFFTTCIVPPQPGTITGPAQVCRNGTGYTFSVGQVANGFYYNWTFPAGFTFTTYEHSNVVTVDAGSTAVSGTVSVIAVSGCGAPSTASSLPVTVNLPPVPTITGTSPSCQGSAYNYTTQPGMNSYNWTVSPDGTITPTANPNVVTVNWATTGAKTLGVTYTNTATGCPAAAPGTIPVNVIPAPVPTIAGQNHMCANSGYYNYTTQTGMSGYAWSISSGGSITFGQGTANVQVTWDTPGPQTLSVTYAGANSCFAATPTILNVTVDGLPGPSGSVSGPSEVCYNSTGSVYTVAPITNTMAYVWNLPAGAVITAGAGTSTITVDFTAVTADGNVSVYGNSLCGNGDISPSFPVTIHQLPAAAGTITGPAAVCDGETGVAYSVTPVANATGYRWTLPLGAVIVSGDYTPNIIVDFPAGTPSGIINVYGVNLCGNGAASADINLTVKPTPVKPAITVDYDVLTSNATTGNQWYYNGAMIVGATNQTLTAVYDGEYWVVVTVDGCVSDSSNHIYVTVSGTEEKTGSKLFIYPVPNEGSFNVQIMSTKENSYDVNVYNTLGVSIWEKKNVVVNGQTNLTVDLRPIPDGIYTVILRNDESRIVRKITVNR